MKLVKKFLNIWFLGSLLLNPIAGAQKEENYKEQNLIRLTSEIQEKVLSYSSHLTMLALSQTCKSLHNTIAPFVSLPWYHIEFTRHFANTRTTFKLAYAKPSFWILARTYEESDNSSLSAIKINTANLEETLIQLKITLGWSGRGQFPTHYSTGSANPVSFSPCPHGGVFVYAPVDASSNIVFVSDSGAINSQPVLKDYAKSYFDLSCGGKYLALNSKYESLAPILFVPYQIQDDNSIYYTAESDNDHWPRIQKFADRGHSISPLEDKFLLEVNNGFLDQYGDVPNVEKSLIINPEFKERMMEEKGESIDSSSNNRNITAIVKNAVFPKHYKLLSEYNYLKEGSLLFIVGRLKTPGKKEEDIYGVSQPYQGLDYRKPEPYPYGVILIKNLTNSEVVGKVPLFETRQLNDIENESMRVSNFYLFVTTYFRKSSTPKLTAIDIRNIKRLSKTQ